MTEAIANSEYLSTWQSKLFLIGPSGSGKTVVARRLAESLGWRLIDTDEEVRRATAMSSIAEIFDALGEPTFRRMEVECLDLIADLAEPAVVATGGGLPVTPGSMERILEIGVPVYLRASINTLWQRLTVYPEGLVDRPLLRSGGIGALQELLERRQDVYMRAPVIFDTDHLSLDEVVEMLHAMLS